MYTVWTILIIKTEKLYIWVLAIIKQKQYVTLINIKIQATNTVHNLDSF